MVPAARAHFRVAGGDLVFFNSLGHVSIYLGNGLMIDAPRTGEQVRLLPLNTDWYASNYDGAVRP